MAAVPVSDYAYVMSQESTAVCYLPLIVHIMFHCCIVNDIWTQIMATVHVGSPYTIRATV